ncbi:kelch-like protein 5 [Oppia nitens]|uniref:kelch-like protein 5 n=1 Tax=Oppia nitens TaxID=1686743 RepID=UPI0023DB711B|nr:kelch-like protein 5 [Oppia nitens]
MSLKDLSSTSGNQLTAPVADSPDATTTATAFDWDVFADRGKALRQLRQTREANDVMIVTNDDGEKCVRLPIVSTLGPQFTQSQVTAMNESNAETVQLLDNGSEVKKIGVQDMDKQVSKSIIDMTFESTLCISDDTIWPLIRAAIDYEMTDVLDASLLFLATRLDNCVQYFHLGIQHQHRLSNAAFIFIKENSCDVIYKCIDLPELLADEITVLIANVHMKSEQTVYEAIIHWIHWSANERSGHQLLSNLRYARLEIVSIKNTVAIIALIVEDQDRQQLVNKFVDTFRTFTKKKDGYGLYVGLHPEAIRPRVPHEIAIVFGGWQEGVPSTMLKVYDIRTNRCFDTKISHNSPRAYHGMQIINGLVYVIGGTDGINLLKTVQCFDTITKRRYDRQDMNEKRCYVSTVVVDGNIYAMGGHNGQHRIKSCEKYDPQTKVIDNAENMGTDVHIRYITGSMKLLYQIIFILFQFVTTTQSFDINISFDKDLELTATGGLILFFIGLCFVGCFLTVVYCLDNRYRLNRGKPVPMLPQPLPVAKPIPTQSEFIWPNNGNIFVKEITRISKEVNHNQSIKFDDKSKEIVRFWPKKQNRFYNG